MREREVGCELKGGLHCEIKLRIRNRRRITATSLRFLEFKLIRSAACGETVQAKRTRSRESCEGADSNSRKAQRQF